MIDAVAAVGSGRRLLSTKVALAIGFGVLLTLLVVSGIYAVNLISGLESRNEGILTEFLGRQTKLDELRSAIYLAGTYVRDFLLEPEPAIAEQSRRALVETRRQIQSMVSPAAFEPDPAGRAMFDALRAEIDDYLGAIDPVLTWDTQQRRREGYRFLHDQVLPRRSSALGIANTIVSVNQQQLVERDHRLLEMFTNLRGKLTIAVAVMFLCGLALAFAAALHILRLEAGAMEHLKEVTGARQELRSLSARLVETQENERKNISRDLHDAVGQSMAAVQFELHDLGVVLAPYPEALRTRVDRIRELVESSVAMVRNMALLLRPSMLDDLGLAAALEWHANQISRSTGLRIKVEAEGIPSGLPEEHKICVFRIVQEALNNVCKHARASSVSIKVLTTSARVGVTIQDDGRGFRLPRPHGLGLIGMQERAESLGGTLAVHSGPGQGTTIEVALPLPQQLAAGCTSPGAAA